MATRFSGIPSATMMFQAYASISATIAIFTTMLNQLVPRQVQQYVMSKILSYFGTRSSDKITLVIEQKADLKINEVYNAAEIYLSARRTHDIDRFRVSKNPKKPNIIIKFGNCGKISDSFQGVELVWRFVHQADQGHQKGNNVVKRYFELSFNKEYKDKILNCYIPFVLEQAKIMSDQKKVIKMHSLSDLGSYNSVFWDSKRHELPSTFDTLALEPKLKKAITEDLDRFLKRKEFYRKVGKAWKRGYLLYGPPGTGKSSLIAAMANYLKFDIYDLDFSNVRNDSHLRKVLLSTKNRSIIVIEDIDCSVDLPDRSQNHKNYSGYYDEDKVTLSALLNVIDGLWSSCGDEKVIIFTTNYKEKLDPALLRPGRMDMHIHMSYLTIEGFKILAANYIGIHDDDHSCFAEIEKLIETMQVTPAEVAEEFMRSEDPDVCLANLVNFLKQKRITTTNQEKMKQNGIKRVKE